MNESLKIVLCANTSWYLFNFRKSLIRVLLRNGHTVYCVAPFDAYSKKLRELGAAYVPFRLSRTGTNPFQELGTCLELYLVLWRIRPDLLLTFTPKGNIYGGLCARGLSIFQVANVSGLGTLYDGHGWTRWIRNGMYSLGLGRAKRVFFQNQEDLDDLVCRKRLFDPIRCSRLPGSGVNLKKFKIVDSFGTSVPSKRVFMMYGRLLPKKGYDVFLEAAKHLRAIYKDRADFWIMGGEDRSDKESCKLLDLIMSYHETKTVTYIPWTDDIESILRQVDVIVQPTQYHEGVPRTLLEGLSCGKPLITTDWKGARDTVDHGINGFLVQPNDCQQLIEYLKQYIEMPMKQLRKMGHASRRKAEKEFNEDFVIQCYLREISKVMSLKRRNGK